MFLLFLKRFWPHLIIGALTAYGTHWIDSAYYNHRQKTALEDQEKELKAACAADKEITKGVSHDFQTKNALLHADIGRLNRLYDTACVPVTGTAAGHNAATGTGKPVAADGVNAQALLTFAGDAEGYRLQLIGCQDFIGRVWKAHGQ